jgi:hypothetical protein
MQRKPGAIVFSAHREGAAAQGQPLQICVQKSEGSGASMKKYLLALSLALAASPAPAAVFREDISTEISSDQYFPTSFAPFDVGLGQLGEETILLSGTASVSYGTGPASFGVYLVTDDFGDVAQAAGFGFYGDPQSIPISIDWSFPAFNSGVDFFETETISSNFNRVVNRTQLSGEVEYFYTPNASTVPEASTWAMGRVFRDFDQERFAFREQSADGSPFVIVEFDFH